MKPESKAIKSVQALMSDFHRALEHRYVGIITHTSPELHKEQFEGFTHEQLSGLAAYLFLPKNDDERHSLILAFEQKPKSFAETDRKALANYLKHGAEIRMRYGLDWRNCLKDPQLATDLPASTVKTLDKVAAYVQMPQGDPHERFNLLLRNALQLHVIPADVFAKLHDDVFDFLKPPPRVDLELFRDTIERMKHAALGQAVEDDVIPVMEAAKVEAEEHADFVMDVQTPEEDAAAAAVEKMPEADKGRKVHIWYERLVELSGGPDAVPSEKQIKPKAKEEKENKEERRETKKEKSEVTPKQKKEEPVHKVVPKDEKKPVKATKPATEEQSGEAKRRDLLGKLQALGSF